MTGVSITPKVAGLLMAKEIKNFAKLMEKPEKPVLAILGGAKVADKIGVIYNLMDKVDMMYIGGGMCFTFLSVLNGSKVGKSILDPASTGLVKVYRKKAERKGVKMVFPTDFVCADKKEATETSVVDIAGGIPDSLAGFDIGPQSSKQLAHMISQARTILWNGPMGVFETDQFAQGTKACLDACVSASSQGATVICGGGETVMAVEKYNAMDKITHVSTGGGASLELLEGKEMPGILFLDEKH